MRPWDVKVFSHTPGGLVRAFIAVINHHGQNN